MLETVTLEISQAEHAHLIGKGGVTITGLMRDNHVGIEVPRQSGGPVVLQGTPRAVAGAMAAIETLLHRTVSEGQRKGCELGFKRWKEKERQEVFMC